MQHVIDRPRGASFAARHSGTDNLCPFGCEVADLDPQGYCRHLVGFSNDPKSGIVEPLATNDWGYRFVHGARPEAPHAGDQFRQVGISFRVYRPDGQAPAQKEK